MGGGVTAAGAPVQRRYPAAPLVGVAAAVFDGAGRVLLVQRGRPPRAGSWGLPGGLLDVGERLVDGAAREVREECGIDIRIGGVAGVFEPITYDEAGRVEYHYVVVDFWASYASGVATAQDDAAAVAWVSMGQLGDYHLHPDSQQVVEDAQRLWAMANQSEQNGQPA
jgi:ADP-ribose pyrophosphatase YjhB (NUDIX family)